MTIGVGILTPIIELIPELGPTHCTAENGVAKQPGTAWVAAGIEDPTTTRLYFNQTTRLWTSTYFSGGNETACAKSAATAASSAGDIYVYPSITRIGSYINQRQDQYDGMTTIGAYLVVNQSDQQIITTKETSASFGIGDTLYWDLTNGRATKNGVGANKLSFEYASRASAAGSSRALVHSQYAYYEGFSEGARQLPLNVVPLELPKISGQILAGDSQIAKDISGRYFSFVYYLPATNHGIFEDEWSIDTAPASAATFSGYQHRARTKFQTNDNLLMSAINPRFVTLFPTFGTSSGLYSKGATSELPNSEYWDCISKPTSGGDFMQQTMQRFYEYKYVLRNYRTLNENSDGIIYTRAAHLNMTFDIPTGLVFTRTPSSDPYEWSPPPEIDQTSTHSFLLGGPYGQSVPQSQPTWKLIRKEPFPAAASSYHKTGVCGNKAPPFDPHNFWFLVIPDQSGSQQVTDLEDAGYAVDLARTWNYGMASIDSLTGSAYIDAQIVYINVTGGEEVVQAWQTLTRSDWFTVPSVSGSKYIRYTGSTSLAALGVTDPQVKIANYRMDCRHYSAGVSPYHNFSVNYGDNFSSGFNFFGAINDFTPDCIAPFPLDVYPYRVRTRADEEITTDFYEGWHDNFIKPEISWAGGFTHSVSAVGVSGSNLFLIRTASDLVPTISDPDLQYIQILGEVTKRITRTSDGCTPWQYFNYVPVGIKGIVWSHKAKSWHITPVAPVNGTGYRAFYPESFNIAGQLVDIPPNKLEETFEIETMMKVQLLWHNKRTTYQTYRDVQTITIPA